MGISYKTCVLTFPLSKGSWCSSDWESWKTSDLSSFPNRIICTLASVPAPLLSPVCTLIVYSVRVPAWPRSLWKLFSVSFVCLSPLITKDTGISLCISGLFASTKNTLKNKAVDVFAVNRMLNQKSPMNLCGTLTDGLILLNHSVTVIFIPFPLSVFRLYTIKWLKND